MAVPILSLNLAPRPSVWRQHHQTLGWLSLGLGSAFLLGILALTWRAYHQASRAGREAVSLTEESRRAARQEQQIQASLQDMDATREQFRWKQAERILQERSLPWSRLTVELEQCMVPDMRLKGLQRSRSQAQQVVMKVKGEARTRQAEAAFIEALQAAPVFAEVVLDRESERTGGGWDFELSLPAAAVPPPFRLKPPTPQTQAAPVRAPHPPVAPQPSALSAPAKPQVLAPPPPRPAGSLVPGGPEPSQARPLPAEDDETRGRRRPRLSGRPEPPRSPR